jgi:single-stranded DNA-binding protein
MSNPLNNTNLIGRLAADPRVFPNSDGSKKVLFTLYVDRNYRNAGGEVVSDQIPVEAFVSKDVNGLGPYSHIHAGDLVAVQAQLELLPYTDKGTNEKKYPGVKIVSNTIQFLESRATTQGRLAKRVLNAEAAASDNATQAAPAPAAAEAENAYENDSPFAGANA